MSSTVSPPSQSFVGFTNSQFHPPRKEKKREQFISLFLYSLFNLGSSMSLIYVMSLQLPYHLKLILAKDSTFVLGILVSFASVANILGSFVAGLLADKTHAHIPIIIAFNFLWSLTIVARSLTSEKNVGFIILYCLLTVIGLFLYAFVEVPYTSLMPALFQRKNFGTVSGGIGFTMIIGTAIGLSGMALLINSIGESFLSILAAIFINFLSLSLLPLISRKKKLRNDPEYFLDFYNNKSKNLQKEIIIKKILKRKGYENEIEKIERNQPNLEDSGNLETVNNKEIDDIEFEPKKPGTFDSKGNFHSKLDEISSWKRFAIFLYQLSTDIFYPFLKPFFHKNYTLIVLVRFWTYMSLSSIQTYTYYFINDVVTKESDGTYSVFGYNIIKSTEYALGLFSICILVTALFSTVFFGWLSDRYSQKKYYVFIACSVGSVLQILIVLTHNYNVMLLCGFVIGVCIGVFVSIDFALANEVLPDKEEASKDLAIYASSKTLPILFATPISGFLLYIGNNYVHPPNVIYIIPPNTFGYFIIYILSAMFSLIAGICAVFISNTRPPKIIYAKLVLD